MCDYIEHECMLARAHLEKVGMMKDYCKISPVDTALSAFLKPRAREREREKVVEWACVVQLAIKETRGLVQRRPVEKELPVPEHDTYQRR